MEGKEELLYWEINGNVKTAKKSWDSIMLQLEEGKLCGEWIEGVNQYGHWLCKLYTTVEGVYIIKEWIPSPGYIWQEVQVLKLNL